MRSSSRVLVGWLCFCFWFFFLLFNIFNSAPIKRKTINLESESLKHQKFYSFHFSSTKDLLQIQCEGNFNHGLRLKGKSTTVL